jgi:hypothetical protein
MQSSDGPMFQGFSKIICPDKLGSYIYLLLCKLMHNLLLNYCLTIHLYPNSGLPKVEAVYEQRLATWEAWKKIKVYREVSVKVHSI